MAEKNNVHFLGSIPIDINVRILGDKGRPIILEKPDCEVTMAFQSFVSKIELHYSE
jgi:tRNA U54 and U55 pseudouridine synthase Pus10